MGVSKALEDLMLADLVDHEGNVRWPYCDRKGLVTIMVGNLVREPRALVALPMFHIVSGIEATDEEKAQAWQIVHDEYAKAPDPVKRDLWTAKHYQDLTSLRVTREFGIEHARARLRSEFLPALYRLYHNFDSMPEAAQRVNVDMIYSLGIHGMNGISRYPRFVGACQAGNFLLASQECIRGNNPNSRRNRWARDLLKKAAKVR